MTGYLARAMKDVTILHKQIERTNNIIMQAATSLGLGLTLVLLFFVIRNCSFLPACAQNMTLSKHGKETNKDLNECEKSAKFQRLKKLIAREYDGE